MSNELVKVLILFALYAALEIALYSSSVGRLVSRAVRAARLTLSEQDARTAE
ncbi:hypothetical protein ACVIWV_003023 [Bradyrhizobium diazoefficiens]|jgi:hypothetical protein|uniref:Uncharacterized protein n=1 Tax=Bradyrhizobium diazoefficiens TaxID=1355477 RepID=A0A810C7J8_9BRAD|nr:hypothetical protein [Bradyrhizobium diazoefficiens]MBP1065276.1 hypothetical protein [Bradyrhizobium japonicum]MBP1092631.1 hypothetical protein [Bradyrhizobium japonicum]WLA60954.1 hypothetical protein QIH81_20530 [Bradyrhizobium diazoefficiens]BBZ95348.1 hypothetical protein F07S3_51810 [Bradyrhizobium diazoefficiens]BCA04455.1 hypothetical protein H12S4_53590 [Bradyrhizobium diazoefficiens]